MLGGVLVLIQVLNERVHLWYKRGSFILFTIIGLALGRGMVQNSNLAYL